MIYQAIIVGFMMFLATHSNAASFDCQKAKLELEHTICEHKKLNQLDSELGTAYQNLLKKLAKAEAGQLQQQQRRWLELRQNHCGVKNPDCLITLYHQRIATLEFRSSADYASSPAGKLDGKYIAKNMELRVEALALNKVFIWIEGAEPKSGKWTCDFSGEGKLHDNTVQIKALDDAFVTVTFRGATAEVNEGETSLWCGMGGTLNGKYQKK